MTWPANKILRVLHVIGMEATAQQIADATGLTIEKVWDACETLANRGLIIRAKRGVYAINDAGETAVATGQEIKCGPQGPTGPKIKKGTLCSRLWAAIRMERKNTVGGWLSLILPDGADKKANHNAQKYVCALCAAGYMTRLPGKQQGTALTSNGYTRYLLITDTGPLAPMVRRIERELYDPNIKRSVPFSEGV